MTTYDRASARTTALAQRLVAGGVDPTVAADAMIVSALALWAAQTDNAAVADFLTRAWATARDAAHG